MVAFVKSLPQPLKTLYILTFAVFAVSFVLILIGIVTDNNPVSPPIWFSILGALFVLIGICFVTDFNSSARAAAAAAAKSSSVPFSPTLGMVRLIGAFFVAFGCVFVFVSLTVLS